MTRRPAEPAPWPYGLLAVAWAVAIGLVVYLAAGASSAAPEGWRGPARTLGPVAAAFALTLLVRAGSIRAAGLVLLGCAWVSALPLAIIGAKIVYAGVALAPPCRAYAEAHGRAYRGVRFELTNAAWWEPNRRTGVFCLYESAAGTGQDEVALGRAVGRARDFGLTVGGAVAVVGAGLLVWAVPTGFLACWLVRRARPPAAETGVR